MQFLDLTFHCEVSLLSTPLSEMKLMNEHAINNKYFATAKELQLSNDMFFDDILPAIGHTLMGKN